MKRLMNKICMVTGGGSGIGKAICHAFAQEGAKVIILDINQQESQCTVKEIQMKGYEAICFHGDVTVLEDWRSIKREVLKRYGKLDVLVNNTGIFTQGAVADISAEAFQRVMNVNVTGIFQGMNVWIPEMKKQKAGAIINIASEAGIAAIPGQVAYNVSKAAVIMLTKSTAVDYAADNIRVNCICPGRVHTPLVQRILDEAEDSELQYRIMSEDRPVKKMGKPEDIAAGAVYFAGEESGYATGAVLSIDGGYVCP